MNDGGDDCLFMSDSDYEGSQDEETELPPEIFGCNQETSFKDVPLMVAELSSLAGGYEVDMREIDSIHRIFVECRTEDNLRANLVEENTTVIEEVPCIVEKRGCLSRRDEEESVRNKNKVKRKSNGSVCPTVVSSEPRRFTDSQTNRIGEKSRHVD